MNHKIKIISPFPEPDYFLLWEWAESVWNAVSDDFTPENVHEFIQFQSNWDRLPHIKTWAVFVDGAICGYVRLERNPLRQWLGDAHCIFRKSVWGRKAGITDNALITIAHEIFDSGIERIGMNFFSNNGGMQALAKRLGAVEEGCLSMQTKKNDQFVSIKVFALTRKNLEEALQTKENHYANGGTGDYFRNRHHSGRIVEQGEGQQPDDLNNHGNLLSGAASGSADALENLPAPIQ